MHAAVRRYQAVDVEALVQKIQEEFLERVTNVEGFVS